MGLKQIRKSQGYKQKEVAKGIGVSQGCINNYEHGLREISLDTMRKLAKFLDVEPWQLLPDDMQPSFFRKDITLQIDYGVRIYNEALQLNQQHKKVMDLVLRQAEVTNRLLEKYNQFLDGVENGKE